MLLAYSSEHLYRRMLLNYENLFFEVHLILDVKTTFRLQKACCEHFWWKHIKNEGCKCYLVNKEEKAMFLVVSQLDVYFGFELPIFCVPDRAQ